MTASNQQGNQHYRNYVMGLDIGTASCALSVYYCDDSANATELAFLDGTIFSEPIENETLKLLNQSRRAGRGMRRQIERRATRKRKLLYIALSLGLDKGKLQQHEFAYNIHELRADSEKRKLDIYELFAVFLHMLQNRGPKHLKDHKELGEDIQDKNLATYLLEKKQAVTIEGKNAHFQSQPWRKLQQDADNSKTLYYARFLLEHEFEALIEQQKQHHPFLQENYTGWPDGAFKKQPNSLIDYTEALRQTMIEQRPLKWSLDTIGNCPFKENCKVASKAHPAFQNFRIEQQINNLSLVDDVKLNPQQLQILRDELHHSDELFFSKIYELLNLQTKLTIDTANNSNTSLMGNKTLHAMQKLGLAEQWQAHDMAQQAGIITLLANLPDLNYIKENTSERLNHEFKENLSLDKSYHYTDKQISAITSFLISLSTHKKFGSLKDMGLETGRGNYSSVAYQELADAMQQHQCDKTIAKEKLAYQPLDLDDVITNPIVLKAIRQVEQLYKEAMRKMGGAPMHVSLELMRELKQSIAKRDEIRQKIKNNTTRRKEYTQELQALNITPTDKNIKRFTLAREQNYQCAYTGNPIEMSALEHYEIDHIIPQAKGGSSAHNNLVLVERDINERKKIIAPPIKPIRMALSANRAGNIFNIV